MKNYYFITASENADEILCKGILANSQEEIFLFENVALADIGIGRNREGKLCRGVIKKSLAEIIATKQGLKSYALFEVSEGGIFGKMVKASGIDMVADRFTWIAQQPIISKKHIRLLCTKDVDHFAEFIAGTFRELAGAEKEKYTIPQKAVSTCPDETERMKDKLAKEMRLKNEAYSFIIKEGLMERFNRYHEEGSPLLTHFETLWKKN